MTIHVWNQSKAVPKLKSFKNIRYHSWDNNFDGLHGLNKYLILLFEGFAGRYTIRNCQSDRLLWWSIQYLLIYDFYIHYGYCILFVIKIISFWNFFNWKSQLSLLFLFHNQLYILPGLRLIKEHPYLICCLHISSWFLNNTQTCM